MVDSLPSPQNPEIPVSNEAVQPAVDEVERLMSGVMSATDEIPGTDQEDFVIGTRAARFPVNRGGAEAVFIDQIIVPGELTTRVRIDKPNPDLTTARHIVTNVKKITISSDDAGLVRGYEYSEELEVHAVETMPQRQTEGNVLEAVDLKDPELLARNEARLHSMQDAQREIQGLQPKFDGNKLDEMLAILASVSVEDREIEEGSEEPTINV